MQEMLLLVGVIPGQAEMDVTLVVGYDVKYHAGYVRCDLYSLPKNKYDMPSSLSRVTVRGYHNSETGPNRKNLHMGICM